MVSKHKTYLLPGRNEGRSISTFRQLLISTLWTSKGYGKKLNNDQIHFLPLSQVFSGKTLKYTVSHLSAKLQVFSLFTISLGRPEIFEKVAKIGVGVHIWPLQVSKLTYHEKLDRKQKRI